MKFRFLLLLLFALSFNAQAQKNEVAYKAALDSLDYYLHFFQQKNYDNNPRVFLHVVSTYNPLMINNHLEDTSDVFYLNRSKGRKDCIFLFDGTNFLVLYLKDLDTNFIQLWRSDYIRIVDTNKKEKKKQKLLYCNIAAESNNRGGTFLEEYIIAPVSMNNAYQQKLIYYFNQAILLSR